MLMKNMNDKGRWKVMIHMIALVKQGDVAFAYHFATADKKEK